MYFYMVEYVWLNVMIIQKGKSSLFEKKLFG